MSEGGKGSKPRPLSVAHEEYSQRWDQIFGNKQTNATAPNTEKLRWISDGVSPHNGEYWYRCSLCGDSDWIASYGTVDQLKCSC